MNPVSRASRVFVLLAGTSLALGAQGTVVGHVREPGGLGIAGADVRVEGSAARGISDAGGAFRLGGAGTGRRRIAVRRLGFRPATIDTTVTAGTTLDLTVTLEPLPTGLPPVVVREVREVVDPHMAAFDERMKRRSGHFFTRDRIDRLAPSSVLELMRAVPGAKIGPIRGSVARSSVRFRGAAPNCFPLVVIDGFVAGADEYDLETIDLASVEAAEVYVGYETVPSEFMIQNGTDACGVIAVWLRTNHRTRKREPRPVTTEELQKQLSNNTLVTASDADTQAVMLDSTLAAPLPDSLLQAGIEGMAHVEFVVGTDGAAEMETFHVISESDPALGRAARSSIQQARFSPAVRGGRRVRQLLQLRVQFRRPPPPTGGTTGSQPAR